jgi:hypothetical protein
MNAKQVIQSEPIYFLFLFFDFFGGESSSEESSLLSLDRIQQHTSAEQLEECVYF